MPPPLCMPKGNATIILKSVVIQKMTPQIEKKSCPLVYRACQVESIDT